MNKKRKGAWRAPFLIRYQKDPIGSKLRITQDGESIGS